MIEDGTAAIVFGAVALLETLLSGVSPIAIAPAPETVTVSAGPVFFEEEAIGGEIRLSYSPPATIGVLDPVIDFSVTEEGSAFVGLGLRWEREVFDLPVFLGLEFIPGAYFAGSGPDLGGVFEVRTGVELGYVLNETSRISIITDHRSNAGIGDINPGLETISLRFQRRF